MLTRCSCTASQLNSEKQVTISGGVGRGLKITLDSTASVFQHTAAGTAQGSASRWQGACIPWRRPWPCSHPPFLQQPSHLSPQLLPRMNREAPDRQTADYESHSPARVSTPRHLAGRKQPCSEQPAAASDRASQSCDVSLRDLGDHLWAHRAGSKNTRMFSRPI